MAKSSEKAWFAAVASIESCVLCGQRGVQVSHSNMFRGMGQKSKPWMTAALCPECHNEIDNGKNLSKLERRELHMRAIALTHDALIERNRIGLLK